MAIVEDLPGVEVEILVDGKPLNEYLDDDAEDYSDTHTCYVEAMTGKIFQIRLKVEKGVKITRQLIAFDIIVDGKLAHWPFMYASTIKSRAVEEISLGRYASSSKLQRYCFAELETGRHNRGNGNHELY